jgi:voltage-gated potassium channel
MLSVTISRDDLKFAGYELFIVTISILALVNTVLILLPVLSEVNDQVMRTMNQALSLIFLADFLFRLARAESRTGYVVARFGWADLLSAMPFPIFQLFRLPRILRSSYVIRSLGGRKTYREVVGNRAGGALFLALILAILLLQFSAMLIVSAESDAPLANIRTGADAIWWAYVTITTIGYGDFYPVTPVGRWLGVMVMTVGVGLFGVLTGFLANLFLGRPRAQEEAALAEQTGQTVAEELADSLSQLDELQAMLAAQEQHFEHIRERIAAVEEELRRVNGG